MTSSPGQFLAEFFETIDTQLRPFRSRRSGQCERLECRLVLRPFLAQGIAHSLPDIEVAHHDAIVGQLTAERNARRDDGDSFFFHLLEHRIETVVRRGPEHEHVDALGHHGLDLRVLLGHVSEFAGNTDLDDFPADAFGLVHHSVGHALPEIVLQMDESDAVADDGGFVLNRVGYPQIPVLLFSANGHADSDHYPYGHCASA